MTIETLTSMNIVREAFHYQNRFASKTIVFKIEFPVTEEASFPYLMKDIGMLAKAGIKVVIVQGASEYIDRVLKEHNKVSQFLGGERITKKDEIPYVETAAFHAASLFMTALSVDRVDAVVGNFVRARGRGVVNGSDFECTGSVDKIFSKSILRILDAGMIPILPCIGWSAIGKPYNVPGDEIAIAVCKALDALKLIIVQADCKFNIKDFDVPKSVERDDTGRLLRLNPDEARIVLETNIEKDSIQKDKITKGRPELNKKMRMLNLLNLAVRASDAGVERTHIIDSREEGGILRELFSNLGAGTMVYADEYEAIRGIHNSDISDMLRLMEPLMQKNVLLRRTAEDIQKKKDDYVVFVIDGSVHGCAALHNWGEDQAEIAALAASRTQSEIGIGRRIVKYLIEKAKKTGYKRVFVLTTNTQDWFETMDFRETPIDTLPKEKLKLYNRERNSKAFALDL
jgi:amino-acid N-acetyltransferase